MAKKSLFKRLAEKVFSGGKKTMKKKIKAKKSKAKKATRKPIKKIVKKKIVKKAAKKKLKIAAIKIAVQRPAKNISAKTSKVIAATPVILKPLSKKEKKALKMKKGPRIAYLGLGSNVGDREEYIEQAIFLLSKTPGIKMRKKSANYETEPEGNSDQPQFLNAAVEIQTMMDPYKLLTVLHETENALGREREVEWGPRTIDLDILLYDGQIVSDDKLQIPHPLLHERLFVLKPLSEIAPNALHPALEKTIMDIYEERKNEIGDKYDDDLPGFKDIKKGAPDDYERW
jgi:2-amino-4-hydroxy-6-hydroxymethyldihydropteridine diphosphokinase